MICMELCTTKFEGNVQRIFYSSQSTCYESSRTMMGRYFYNIKDLRRVKRFNYTENGSVFVEERSPVSEIVSYASPILTLESNLP